MRLPKSIELYIAKSGSYCRLKIIIIIHQVVEGIQSGLQSITKKPSCITNE